MIMLYEILRLMILENLTNELISLSRNSIENCHISFNKIATFLFK